MLSNRLFTLLAGLLFILMMMAAMFFVQFSKYNLGQKAFGGEQLSLPEYARYSYDQMVAQQKARAAEKNFDITQAMPAAPSGWVKTGYLPTHGERITGRAYQPTLAPPDTEHSLQNKFRHAGTGVTKRTAASYLKGYKILSVYLKTLEGSQPNTLEAQVEKQLEALPVSVSGSKAPEHYLTLAGVPLKQLPQLSRNYSSGKKTAVNYRHFTAVVGGQIEVGIITNATDADIKPILNSIDAEMLKRYAATRVKTASPQPPQSRDDQLAANTAELTPEEAAVAAAVAAGLGAEVVSDKGFISRLKTLLLQSGGDEEEEIKKPLRAKCKKKKGFKHCVFPKEEDE